uniref:Uncharacterized protein LOC100177736 n=1 Tax=Phallusia mammillata TaxID=59560 RepID=A0A6F9DHG8_9ASCI|nr:uncharacterized protein LOC100177736 [Phallusia mammillata]
MSLPDLKTGKRQEKKNNSLLVKVKSWKKEAWSRFISDIERFLEGKEDDNLHSSSIPTLLMADSSTVQSEMQNNTQNLVQQSTLVNECLKSYDPKGRKFEEAMLYILSSGFSHNVILKVGNERFFSHREILSSRCKYFASMFSSSQCWSEIEKKEITLSGIQPNTFAIFLCYTYGLFVDLSSIDNTTIASLAGIADMFNSVYINHAVELFLVKQRCHIFHKPCPECSHGFAEALQLSCVYNLINLKEQCLLWNVEYFPKLWHTESFCSMPSEIIETCYAAVVHTMDIYSVSEIALKVDILLGGLTSVKWEKPMVDIARKLMNQCEIFISKNLFQLTENGNWDLLFKGMGCRTEIVERILEVIGANITNDNACLQYIAVKKLLESAKAEEWNPNTPALQKLFNKLEKYLSTSYFAIIHTKGWEMLPDETKAKIGKVTMSGADPGRKPARKPVLTSSKATKTRVRKVTVKEKPPTKLKLTEKKQKCKKASDTPLSHPHDVIEPPSPPEPRVSIETLYDVIKDEDVRFSMSFLTLNSSQNLT